MAQEIIIIAAIGKNRELGIGPELVWRLTADLKRFKALTLGHVVIMGRKTFESIGKPLPGRTNIVITRDHAWAHEGVKVAHSLEEAFSYAHEGVQSEKEGGGEVKKVFIIGGGEIYTQALPYATTLELTLIDAEESRANVFFPEYGSLFDEVARSESQEENGVRYVWATYEKKP